MMDQNADGLVDVADLVALHGIMGIETSLRHSKQLDRLTNRQTDSDNHSKLPDGLGMRMRVLVAV